MTDGRTRGVRGSPRVPGRLMEGPFENGTG